jgi:hypothetical protein
MEKAFLKKEIHEANQRILMKLHELKLLVDQEHENIRKKVKEKGYGTAVKLHMRYCTQKVSQFENMYEGMISLFKEAEDVLDAIEERKIDLREKDRQRGFEIGLREAQQIIKEYKDDRDGIFEKKDF